jgi:hypothetical protein
LEEALNLSSDRIVNERDRNRTLPFAESCLYERYRAAVQCLIEFVVDRTALPVHDSRRIK